MPEDLRPAPRLPLDTAEYGALRVGELDAFITYEPGEPVFQTSLIETLTPDYFASAFNRQVYDIDLVSIYATGQEASDVVTPVLVEFNKTNPERPADGP